MSINQCPRCLVCFSRCQRLRSHLNKKNKCHINNSNYSVELELNCINLISGDENEITNIVKNNKFVCEYCDTEFSRKFNLERHLQFYCKSKKIVIPFNNQSECIQQHLNNDQLINTLAEKIKELEKKLEDNYIELKYKSSNIHNNILQVVCVGGNQNYLDMLTEQFGDYDKALNFIKDCALSHLSGDCKLIQRIYFSNDVESPIRYLDKSRGKLEYLDEYKHLIIDYKGQKLGRILANNLQNSYLKGVNYLINKNLSNNLCPNKFLDDYDVQCWNNHIYELSDVKYQRKIINSLEIPVKC